MTKKKQKLFPLTREEKLIMIGHAGNKVTELATGLSSSLGRAMSGNPLATVIFATGAATAYLWIKRQFDLLNGRAPPYIPDPTMTVGGLTYDEWIRLRGLAS